MNDWIAWLLLIIRIFMILSIYAFLFWALYSLWKDLRSSNPDVLDTPHLNLILLATQQVFSIQESSVTLGRSKNSDIQLTNSTVSLNHARCYFSNKQWWYEDLNSRNGSTLNSKQIHDPVPLIDNDTLMLGDEALRVSFTRPHSGEE